MYGVSRWVLSRSTDRLMVRMLASAWQECGFESRPSSDVFHLSCNIFHERNRITNLEPVCPSCWHARPIVRIHQSKIQWGYGRIDDELNLLALANLTAYCHDSISYSVSLSWYWSNQSLPYPSNAEHNAQYSTQLCYPDIELISPCLILGLPMIRLVSDKYQFCMALLCPGRGSNPDLPAWEASQRSYQFAN